MSRPQRELDDLPVDPRDLDTALERFERISADLYKMDELVDGYTNELLSRLQTME